MVGIQYVGVPPSGLGTLSSVPASGRYHRPDRTGPSTQSGFQTIAGSAGESFIGSHSASAIDPLDRASQPCRRFVQALDETRRHGPIRQRRRRSRTTVGTGYRARRRTRRHKHATARSQPLQPLARLAPSLAGSLRRLATPSDCSHAAAASGSSNSRRSRSIRMRWSCIRINEPPTTIAMRRADTPRSSLIDRNMPTTSWDWILHARMSHSAT